jgi:hypothetical protein
MPKKVKLYKPSVPKFRYSGKVSPLKHNLSPSKRIMDNKSNLANTLYKTTASLNRNATPNKDLDQVFKSENVWLKQAS